MQENVIAIIGAGMIGSAHASAYRQFAHRFGTGARLKTVCDTNSDLAADLAARYGFEGTDTDWREVIADLEVSVISVCLPNFLHVEVAKAALEAGKHVICEKPLALSSQSARLVHDAAKATIAVSGTVFNYRRIPALADIKARIESGEIGEPVQIMVKFQCDYAADPKLPFSWRYEMDKAGPGALLDVGTHAVDMARFLFGDVAEVVGAVSTISIPERHLPKGTAVGHGHVELSNETAKVENDDVMTGLVRFANGAQGVITASRVAIGYGNLLAVDVFGTRGSARFSTEMPSFFDMAVFDGTNPGNFIRYPNRPTSPNVGALAAVPHDLVAVGYSEWFGFMIHEFLTAVNAGGPFANGTIEDGYRAAQVLDAIQRASVENAPVRVAWDD